MAPSRATVLLFAVALLALAAPQAKGQTLPDVEQGLKPFDTFEGTDIDSVSMTNGKVSLHIPLFSYAQRGGKLKLDFSIIYNDQGWSLKTGPNNTLISSWLSAQGVYVDESQDMSIYSIASRTCGGTWCVTADGSPHLIATTTSGLDESVDATGISYNTATQTAIDRNGVSFSPVRNAGVPANDVIIDYPLSAAYTKEDPNGNEISYTPTGGWTDTLGRAIQTVPHFMPYGSPPTVQVIGGTATDTSGCQGPLPLTGAYLWAIPGPNGGATDVKFCFATVSLKTNFSGICNDDTSTPSANVLQSIVVYNGTSWSTSPAWEFEYNSPDSTCSGTNYGDLSKVKFPTGGSISYTWCTCGNYGGNPYRTVSSRTLNANDGTPLRTWNYLLASPGMIVTSPLGDDTVYTVTGLGGQALLYITEEDYYQGSHTSGTLLKTIKTDYSYTVSTSVCQSIWVYNIVPIRRTTIWPNGQQAKTESDYDSALSFHDVKSNQLLTGTYGDVVAKREYDYGNGAPGTLIRSTTTSYEAFSNSSYLTNNLLTLQSQVATFSGAAGTGACSSNGAAACTTYGYDEYSLSPSGITTSHNSNPPDGTYRGNQTSVHQWLQGSAVATAKCAISITNGYLVNYKTYYDTGTTYQSTDSCGSSEGDPLHSTKYSYSSTYVGAYITAVTNPLGQSTNYAYDFDTGRTSSVTDPNSQITSYTYDNQWRLATITHPDGGLDTITRQEVTFPFSVTLTSKITSSQNKASTDVFDGLGRVTEHQLQAPCGVTKTDYTFDGDGRKATESNPYCTTSDPTYGITSYQYDPLNRPILVTKPDNSTVHTAYCAATSALLGTSTLVTDEAGRWRRSTLDGLGRLIEVDEPNSLTATVAACPASGDPTWATTYTHDALDDLTGVVQSGSHQRTFSFDSLKHLTSSLNPETGTVPVAYGYDADGNVITKADGRPVTITYSWDTLNRMTSRA